jgi:hypothetical protein
MSYGFDLVRLPSDVDSNDAYERLRRQQAGNLPRAPDDSKEKLKQRLAAALLNRNAGLQQFQRDYARIAQNRSISEDDARRLFRDIELNDSRHSIQITLFDDEAGASFSFSGGGHDCKQAVDTLWNCLELLESEGGFSTFDPQLARVLDLSADYDLIRDRLCGSGSAPASS